MPKIVRKFRILQHACQTVVVSLMLINQVMENGAQIINNYV